VQQKHAFKHSTLAKIGKRPGIRKRKEALPAVTRRKRLRQDTTVKGKVWALKPGACQPLEQAKTKGRTVEQNGKTRNSKLIRRGTAPQTGFVGIWRAPPRGVKIGSDEGAAREQTARKRKKN